MTKLQQKKSLKQEDSLIGEYWKNFHQGFEELMKKKYSLREACKLAMQQAEEKIKEKENAK